jgi:hypothetical protein
VCGGSMLLSLFTSRYNRERSGAWSKVVKKWCMADINGHRVGSASQHLTNTDQILSLICGQSSLFGRPPAVTDRTTQASLPMCENGLDPERICKPFGVSYVGMEVTIWHTSITDIANDHTSVAMVVRCMCSAPPSEPCVISSQVIQCHLAVVTGLKYCS